MGRPVSKVVLNEIGVYYNNDGTTGTGTGNGFWKIVKQESDITFQISDGVDTYLATLVPKDYGDLLPGEMNIQGRTYLNTDVFVSKISSHVITASDGGVYSYFASHSGSYPSIPNGYVWLYSSEYYC
jgi:hypothetical protein